MNLQVEDLERVPLCALTGIIEHFGEIYVEITLKEGEVLSGVLWPDDYLAGVTTTLYLHTYDDETVQQIATETIKGIDIR